MEWIFYVIKKKKISLFKTDHSKFYKVAMEFFSLEVLSPFSKNQLLKSVLLKMQ